MSFTGGNSVIAGVLGKNFSVAKGFRRVSFGSSEVELQNPSGFDVPMPVHNDGTGSSSETDDQSFSFALDNFLSDDRLFKRTWSLHYDRVNYTGLDLTNVLLGTGIALSSPYKLNWGGRFSAGFSAGLSRSESFFDSAIHPTAEIWATAGAQFKSVFLEFQIRLRQAASRPLDNRQASPRTLVRAIALGLVF